MTTQKQLTQAQRSLIQSLYETVQGGWVTYPSNHDVFRELVSLKMVEENRLQNKMSAFRLTERGQQSYLRAKEAGLHTSQISQG